MAASDGEVDVQDAGKGEIAMRGRIALIVVAAAFTWLRPAPGLATERLAGTWRIAVLTSSQSEAFTTSFTIAHGAKDEIVLLDGKKQIGRGTMKLSAIEFRPTTEWTTKALGYELAGATFTGTYVKGGNIVIGTIETPSGDLQWAAVQERIVWKCSNHTPKHSALTPDDVRLLRDGGCTGLHLGVVDN